MAEKDEQLHEDDFSEETDTEANAVKGETDETTAETESAPETSEEEEDTESLLLKQLEELKDTHLRLRAEYDNYRKRTLKEKSDLLKYAAEKVVVDFLEVLDDFDRALETLEKAGEGTDETMTGVRLIHDKMVSKLRSQGVKEMEVLGTPFEAEKHDAVAMVPVEEADKKGTVIDCIQKGYTLNDKVIRHPKVVVGQ